MNTDEAIKWLEKGQPHSNDFYTHVAFCHANEQYEKALSHAIEVLKASQWQTIESDAKDVAVLYYRKYHGIDFYGTGREGHMPNAQWLKATHYMLLPPPPKEGEL